MRRREPGERAADAGRRRSGELEADVLAALWSSEEPMSPGAVQAAVGGELAYTTVMTILVRLVAKGVVERSKVGRSYVYRPIVAESEVVAEHVRRLLDQGQDRTAVLQGLVDGLRPDEETALRALLARAQSEGKK